jgi:hypothetical protein
MADRRAGALIEGLTLLISLIIVSPPVPLIFVSSDKREQYAAFQ